MLNLGTPELLVILVVALLVLGPSRLPEVARQAGKAVAQIRHVADGFQAEMAAAARPQPVPVDPDREAPPATSSGD